MEKGLRMSAIKKIPHRPKPMRDIQKVKYEGG